MSRRLFPALALLCVAQVAAAQPHARFERLARDLSGQARLATCEEGTQPSGALYQLCVPDLLPWNGDLILYAHGYAPVTSPLALSSETELFQQFVTATGSAFAASSFRVNGLAVLPAIEDLRELAALFAERHGAPNRVLVVGASQGGLITTLAVERFPDEFAGGLAMCAPNGAFDGQVDYFGDFRVVFDHFLPGVVPGSPVEIPVALIEGFDAFVDGTLLPALGDPANQAALDAVMAVTRAAEDAADATTREQTITGLIWYNVFATNDASRVLGGQPFDNVGRTYSGSSQDETLNALVARFAAEAGAREQIDASYQSTGALGRPLVTLHTTGDEIVPFWHLARYGEKVAAAGNADRHEAIGVERYGHCNFELLEILEAYGKLLALLDGLIGLGIPLLDRGPIPLARAGVLGASARLICIAIMGACSQKPAPPSFVVITIDTTRADRLGCYGHDRDTSPTVDALAAGGARFDFAIAHSATTPVSCAALLTGRYPYRNGLRTMHGRAHNRLDHGVATLAGRLREIGYVTAGFVSAFPASSQYGLDRGFDLFDESFLSERRPEIGADGTVETARSQRNASETTVRLLPWLRENASRPFFVWLHYFDPHDVTFVPPESIQQRFVDPGAVPGSEAHLSDTYDAEIFFTDLHIRAVVDELERLGVRKQTVVVVTADHGEGLGDHDWWGHGILYQEQIRIPLVFNGPGIEAGRVIGEPVEHVDLAPTLLEMAGAQFDAGGFDGRSLAPVLRSRRGTLRSRVTYSEVHNILAFAATEEQRRRSEMYSIIRPPLKLIHVARDPSQDELYDLTSDPRETHNLMASRPADAAALLADLRARNAIDGYVPDPSTLTQSEREHLRSLGYIR